MKKTIGIVAVLIVMSVIAVALGYNLGRDKQVVWMQPKNSDIVVRGLFIGSFRDGLWQNTKDSEETFRSFSEWQDGFKFYKDNTYLETRSLRIQPIRFNPGNDTLDEPMTENSSDPMNYNPYVGGQYLQHDLAINGDFSPIVENIKQVDTAPFAHFVRNFLDEKGYVNAEVKIEKVWSLDNNSKKYMILAGNGKRNAMPKLMDNENFRNRSDCVYSMLFVYDEEYMTTKMIDAEYMTVDFGLTERPNFDFIFKVYLYDLNGDGKYEVILEKEIIEFKHDITVYELHYQKYSFLPVLHGVFVLAG